MKTKKANVPAKKKPAKRNGKPITPTDDAAYEIRYWPAGKGGSVILDEGPMAAILGGKSMTQDALQSVAHAYGNVLVSAEERSNVESFVDAMQAQRAETNPDVLDKVRAVRKDRQAKYGDSLTDFTRIAGMWSALLGVQITADDVPRMMVCLKLSRSKQSYRLDNMIDVIGYALCHEDLHAPPKATNPLKDIS